MFIKKSLLPLLALALGQADAFWRLPCHGRLVAERIDPIVFPGEVNGHVHAIHGPNTFSANATNADLFKGTCSSCQVKQDKSAYWTPALYFQHADGKFELVPQTGGMLVYYLQRGEDVRAFPPGFQMLAGDPKLREFAFREVEKSHWTAADRTEAALRQRAVGFNCLNYQGPAQAALGLRKMPVDPTGCRDGIRAEVFFPSCWDGKRVTAPDHKDHMRYPSLMDDGVCPPSHPIRLVSLFFETIWNVAVYAGVPGKFVWSNGDDTGYGYHGDFMNAWDQDVLEAAVRDCRSHTGIVEECGVFEHYKRSEQEQCEIIHLDTEEDVVGPFAVLPGNQGGGAPKPQPPVVELPEDMDDDELYDLPKEKEVEAKPTVQEPEVKEPEVKEPEVKEPEVKEPEVKEPEVVGGSPAVLVGEKEPDVQPLVKVVTVTQTTTVDVAGETAAPVRRRHGHGHRHGRAF